MSAHDTIEADLERAMGWARLGHRAAVIAELTETLRTLTDGGERRPVIVQAWLKRKGGVAHAFDFIDGEAARTAVCRKMSKHPSDKWFAVKDGNATCLHCLKTLRLK